MRLGHFLPRILRRLRYELLLAPRGYGKSIPPEAWDKMYRDGAWDHLNAIEEIGHYALIIGYLRFFFDKPTVLDLGCGHGRLVQLLEPHFLDYVGVDISAEAIRSARNLNIPGAHFAVGRFEDYVPKEKLNVIIFNESLGYTERPAELVDKFSHHLLPEGKIVISQLATGNYRAMWRSIGARLERISGARICNARRQTWDVNVFERNDYRYV